MMVLSLSLSLFLTGTGTENKTEMLSGRKKGQLVYGSSKETGNLIGKKVEMRKGNGERNNTCSNIFGEYK